MTSTSWRNNPFAGQRAVGKGLYPDVQFNKEAAAQIEALKAEVKAQRQTEEEADRHRARTQLDLVAELPPLSLHVRDVQRPIGEKSASG